MQKNARTAALRALLKVDVNEGYSNIVIDKTLRDFDLEPRDSALATALFYGVLERRITLDYYFSPFCKYHLDRTDPTIVEILRIAVYQILFMEKIPESAAVNEAVNCARENGAEKAAGFINGVLRSVLREKERLSLPDEKNRPRRLSIEYSCPEWLIRLWDSSYGPEHTDGILASLADRPPVYARVNTIRTTREELCRRLKDDGVGCEPVEWLPGAVTLGNTGSVPGLKAFEEGLFHVQDLSSQLCCAMLAPEPGQRLIDVCSAPGGKAFTLAELMENQGELLAFDKFRGKVGLIRKGRDRLGISIINARLRDGAEPKDSLPTAQRVLCDAPCSGLGIIRRKPEIRYKDPAAIRGLPELQGQILDRSAELVAPGGILVYSTCALNPMENGQVADKFLQEHPEFEPRPLDLPQKLVRAIQEPEHQLTLMPHIHGMDGFFISSFIKKSNG